MRFGDKPKGEVSAISTGCLSLDLALGVGGFPKGRVIEIYGPESSGKTTLALQTLAEAQKLGGVAAFVDVEYALDPEYASNLGVDMNELLISQPDSGEDALEVVEKLVKSGDVACIVVDSVSALLPQAEINGEMGDSHPGLQARLMSQAMRKLTPLVSKSNCCLIFINQIRYKIGVMFGSPETTSGGAALKYYSSVRVDIRRIGQIKDGDAIVGNRTKIKVVKNKVAAPFKEVETDLMYGQGFVKANDLVDLALKYKIIEQKGSWFNYGADNLGQGKDNLKVKMNNTEFQTEILQKINDISQNSK